MAGRKRSKANNGGKNPRTPECDTDTHKTGGRKRAKKGVGTQRRQGAKAKVGVGKSGAGVAAVAADVPGKKQAATTDVESSQRRLLLPLAQRQSKHIPCSGPVSQALFPPTLYTNIEYSNGICVACDGDNIILPKDYMRAVYADPTYPYSPLLPQPDLWAHKYSATEATKNGFPLPVYRHLGTITRIVRAKCPPPAWTQTHEVHACSHGRDMKKRTRISNAQLKKQAVTELQQQHHDDYSPAQLEARIEEIRTAWNLQWSPKSIPRLWDPKHGHLRSSMINDPHHIPLQAVIEWKFDPADDVAEVAHLYHGLRTVPIDTQSVLKSLAELQSPEDLYRIPLIMTYPLVTQQSSDGVFELKIGVYAHRLLPEVIVEQDLLTIMTALDRDSFVTTEPIHVPPTPNQPTFASAPYPKLVFHHDGDDATNETDASTQQESSSSSSTTTTTTTTAAAAANIDLTLADSTRESSDTLSAFTIPGLLKLWEHTGNDITEWPHLEPLLQRMLSMPLLCHQKHAVCWMRQMESLGGFGINSILWEEREWKDGGKYYYSPALGQLRLDRPATMHGGILSDEMGLGKTIMILALIITTLDEMKRTGCHTTLIVVPPALIWQWQAEITKAAPQLSVEVYNAQSSTSEGQTLSQDLDIVLTTYQTLEAVRTSKRLQNRKWGRIVLDEMQEIRSSTTMIAKSCDKLLGTCRWMLSGTPLFDGIEDLKGELNFLSLEPYAAKSEDGFFDFSITNHWTRHSQHGLDTLKILGLLMLRRSKTMTICETGAPLMGLKPMVVEFIPVPQSPYERALYCFLEHVVATQLQDEETTSANHCLCLRLLRELCISPTLLAGGLGASSEMMKLNNLVLLYNRRNFSQQLATDMTAEETLEYLFDFVRGESGSNLTERLAEGRRSLTANRTLSCAEAIRYLSQVQAKVHTAEDFVTDLQLGAGGGMAKRNRATESVEQRIKDCQEKLTRARAEVKFAITTKARSYWHLALERITVGKMQIPIDCRRSITSLWRWRAAVQQLKLTKGGDIEKKLPKILLRGWRPSAKFIEIDLLKAHPDYYWAHPMVLALQNIPTGVTTQELDDAIANALQSEHYKVVMQSHGRAIVQFRETGDAKLVRQLAKNGIEIVTAAKLPFVEEKMKNSRAALEQAKNENDVYPTMATKKRLREAQRNLDVASRGLLIVLDDDSPHVQLVRAKGPPRSRLPEKAEVFVTNLKNEIEESNLLLASNVPIVTENSNLVRNLKRATDIPNEIMQMSAFESLEAMSFKEYHKTSCVICMGSLGSSDPNSNCEASPGRVALTPCGHLFCATCIVEYIESQTASFRQPQCPTCRKDLEPSELIHVDPSLCANAEQQEAAERSKAKNVIQKAAKMLDESNGQLNPDMWLQLFLSIDPPRHVSHRGDPRVSAIPKEVISFFRAATCFEQVHNSASALPNLDPTHGLSSKMQALLRDLPSTKRSVVFTSSRAAVKHLMSLFEFHKIGHRAVFSGQNASQAERAVQEWKDSSVTLESDDTIDPKLFSLQNPLTLIVQAGAAASGLTLTAACRMFFLEPFVRQEEEQQAYARCHRFGQVHPVHAKVYFTPVSVESRLLEWRKQVATANRTDTKVVYTDLMEVDDTSGDEDLDPAGKDHNEVDDQDETAQTLFLLGLQ